MSHDKNEKDHLEKISGIYLYDEVSLGFEKHMQTALSEHVLKGLTSPLLEVGCGDGQWTTEILNQVKTCDIVEASHLLADNIKVKFGDRVTVHETLFENFKSGRKYKTIVLAGVLHHVQDPVTFLQHARECLEPGGSIRIVVPNANSMHRILGKKMNQIQTTSEISPVGAVHGHRRVYDLLSLEKDIKASGLTIRHKSTLIYKFASNAQLNHLGMDLVRALLELSAEDRTDRGAVIYVEATF